MIQRCHAVSHKRGWSPIRCERVDGHTGMHVGEAACTSWIHWDDINWAWSLQQMSPEDIALCNDDNYFATTYIYEH